MSRRREAERLRQEVETFEVRKSQARWWFGVKVAIVAALLVLSFGIFGVGTLVMLSPSAYSPTIVAGSGIAIMLDLLAMAAASIAYVLRPASQPAFGPITGPMDSASELDDAR